MDVRLPVASVRPVGVPPTADHDAAVGPLGELTTARSAALVGAATDGCCSLGAAIQTVAALLLTAGPRAAWTAVAWARVALAGPVLGQSLRVRPDQRQFRREMTLAWMPALDQWAQLAAFAVRPTSPVVGCPLLVPVCPCCRGLEVA